MSDQGIYRVAEPSLVPCSHRPAGLALLGSTQNLKISIFLDRLSVEDYVLQMYLSGQISKGI